MEPGGVHLQVQWELAAGSLMLLFIVFEMLSSGGLLTHWEKANVTPVFKEDKKKGPGNNRPGHFTSVHSPQPSPETISEHGKDKEVAGNSQHGFMKGESCLTDPTAFWGVICAWDCHNPPAGPCREKIHCQAESHRTG